MTIASVFSKGLKLSIFIFLFSSSSILWAADADKQAKDASIWAKDRDSDFEMSEEDHPSDDEMGDGDIQEEDSEDSKPSKKKRFGKKRKPVATRSKNGPKHLCPHPNCGMGFCDRKGVLRHVAKVHPAELETYRAMTFKVVPPKNAPSAGVSQGGVQKPTKLREKKKSQANISGDGSLEEASRDESSKEHAEDPNRFYCSFCSQGFAKNKGYGRRTHLMRHIKKWHGEETIKQCNESETKSKKSIPGYFDCPVPDCKSRLADGRVLRKHLRAQHADVAARFLPGTYINAPEDLDTATSETVDSTPSTNPAMDAQGGEAEADANNVVSKAESSMNVELKRN